MQEIRFYIPLVRDSNRECHHADAWNYLANTLLDLAGGFTDCGIVTGCWRDASGKTIHDDSRAYVIALDSESEWKARRLFRKFCRVFDQQCIYVSFAGQAELIPAFSPRG